MAPRRSSLPTSDSPTRFREAFEATAHERDALDADELVHVNVDVLGAVATVNAALPGLEALRPGIAEALPTFDLARLDRLHAYAWALQHAQGRFVAQGRMAQPLEQLVERGVALRETLVTDVTSLTHRRMIDATRLESLRGGKGYRNLAFDLQVLALVLNEHWGAIAARSSITRDEIAEAERLGAELSDSIDSRHRPQAVGTAAKADRARAYTLFVRAYDEVRRAVAFLRWHEGDADTLAPSLFAGRRPKAKQAPEEEAPPAADEPTPAPAPGP